MHRTHSESRSCRAAHARRLVTARHLHQASCFPGARPRYAGGFCRRTLCQLIRQLSKRPAPCTAQRQHIRRHRAGHRGPKGRRSCRTRVCPRRCRPADGAGAAAAAGRAAACSRALAGSGAPRRCWGLPCRGPCAGSRRSGCAWPAPSRGQGVERQRLAGAWRGVGVGGLREPGRPRYPRRRRRRRFCSRWLCRLCWRVPARPARVQQAIGERCATPAV